MIAGHHCLWCTSLSADVTSHKQKTLRLTSKRRCVSQAKDVMSQKQKTLRLANKRRCVLIGSFAFGLPYLSLHTAPESSVREAMCSELVRKELSDLGIFFVGVVGLERPLKI